jgi:hypothetical protein
MDGFRQGAIRWQELPPDRRRRLIVLIANLIRVRLAAVREAADERASTPDRTAVPGQDPPPPS